MKIYNEIKFDIDTWRVLYEDSFEYDGEIAECGTELIYFIVYIIIVHLHHLLLYPLLNLISRKIRIKILACIQEQKFSCILSTS